MRGGGGGGGAGRASRRGAAPGPLRAPPRGRRRHGALGLSARRREGLRRRVPRRAAPRVVPGELRRAAGLGVGLDLSDGRRAPVGSRRRADGGHPLRAARGVRRTVLLRRQPRRGVHRRRPHAAGRRRRRLRVRIGLRRLPRPHGPLWPDGATRPRRQRPPAALSRRCALRRRRALAVVPRHLELRGFGGGRRRRRRSRRRRSMSAAPRRAPCRPSARGLPGPGPRRRRTRGPRRSLPRGARRRSARPSPCGMSGARP